MWELLALILYSLQWLGVVLGVGAEAVLLVGHLAARHQHRPDWLENIPAVRTVQRLGLLLIAISGAGAVLYQLVEDPTVLLIPTFGFKWMLIALCAGTFWLEHFRNSAWLEGFAGATWMALFVVHSVAPIFMWVDLLFFYVVWLIAFYLVWGTAVWVMGGTPPHRGPRASSREHYRSPETYEPEPPSRPVRHSAPPSSPSRPVAQEISQPVTLRPVAPRPVAVQEVYEPELPHPSHEARASLWQRLMGFFNGGAHEEVAPGMPPPPVPPRIEPPPTPPPMARASAPVNYHPVAIPSDPVTTTPQKPTTVVAPAPVQMNRLPVVEYLEIAPPERAATVAAPVLEQAAVSTPVPDSSTYVPDYSNLPGVRVMPQRPEDLAHESRAPIVQPA